jgi:hypothetical protein
MYLKIAEALGNGAYARKGTTSWVMMAIGPKDSFSQVTATVPEIMDDSL